MKAGRSGKSIEELVEDGIMSDSPNVALDALIELALIRDGARTDKRWSDAHEALYRVRRAVADRWDYDRARVS